MPCSLDMRVIQRSDLIVIAASRFRNGWGQCDEALNYNNALFAGLFSDLVQIPNLRGDVLTLLRSDDRPPALSRAIGKLFAQPVGNPAS